MRLARLEVENWRGLSHAMLDFADGITVIGGPNESGKTSLRSALHAALLLPSTARGGKKLLESHRPWDTKVYPRVRLDFRLESVDYIVDKEFLRQKGWASLKQNGRLVAQDDEAQKKLLDVLGHTAEWIDILWGVQGELRLEQSAPESVKGRLAAAAQDTVMPQVTELQRLITDEYQKYWTEKRGLPTKHLQDLRQKTMDAETSVNKLRLEIEVAEQRTAELDVRLRQLDTLKNSCNKAQSDLLRAQQAISAWETYSRILTEANQLESSAKQFEHWFRVWCDAIAHLRELLPASDRWSEAEQALQVKLAEKPNRREVDNLTARQQYVSLLLEKARHNALAAIVVPDDGEFKELKAAEEKLRNIEASLKMGVLRAELLAEQKLDVSLTLDGSVTMRQSLETGGNQSWSAEQGFDLHLPGIARIKVESGNPGITEDRMLKAQLQDQLNVGLKRFSAATVDELQERCLDKAARLKQIRSVTDTQLFAARTRLVDTSDTTASPSEALTFETSSIEELEQILESAPSAIRVAEQKWDEEQSNYQKLQDEYRELTKSNPVTELNTIAKSLPAHLKNAPLMQSQGAEFLTSMAAPLPITAVWLDTTSGFSSECQKLLDSLNRRAAEVRSGSVRPDGEEVTQASLAKLQQQFQYDSKEIETLSSSVNQAIGAISTQRDLYSRKVAAEEFHAKTYAEQQRMEVDAAAVKELFLAFESTKEQLQQDVVVPLQARVSEYFARMTSGFYQGASFDASLKLSSVATASVSTVSINEISFGTREQLSLLTRLGLAELLSTDIRPQIVILDDNLVHTDDKRMEFACRLLESAASTVQIVIFTCHPERYAGITAARYLTVGATAELALNLESK